MNPSRADKDSAPSAGLTPGGGKVEFRASAARSARLFWAFALLMLAVASAIFFGALLSPLYGLIPLVAAGGSAYAAWSLRKLDRMFEPSEPVSSPSAPGRREFLMPDHRRISLETLFIMAIFLPALAGGASTPILVGILVGCIAVVCAIEIRVVRLTLRDTREVGDESRAE
jgi:hypothetical protein